jgi:aspartate kinase
MKEPIKVFKFGGASLKDAAGIRNVTSILQRYKGQKIVIIVSAMGKITNALEEVVYAYFRQDGSAEGFLQRVKQQHYTIMNELFAEGEEVYAQVSDTFVEIDWILEEAPQDSFDYVYDQIVSVGELVSSRIATAYLNKSGLQTKWADARGLIRTDETWRESIVQWPETIQNVKSQVEPALQQGLFVLTQGFIGSTKDNATTTLGREGSDYSAAILSYCLDAMSMTIWKDVPGVLTADPRLFDNVVKLDRLSYMEAIEMTYYGATVIHPKTIKPLQNKNIPLLVKSFIDPDGEGTMISGDIEDFHYPPMIMVEKNQVLLHISTKDFSFLVEHHIKDLFTIFDKYRIFVNMMQNTAISFYACVTDVPDRMPPMIEELSGKFNIIKDEGLELITVRHSLPQVYEAVIHGKMVLLEERIGKSIQLVVKNMPAMTRKSNS